MSNNKVKVFIMDDDTGEPISIYQINKDQKSKELEELNKLYDDVGEDIDGDIVAWK